METLVRPACAPTRDVPVLASGTELLGVQPGSGYVVRPALVRRSDGQVLALTPLLYSVLDAVNGERDVDQIAAAVTAATGRGLIGEDVCTLLEGRLRPLGLVLMSDGTQQELRKANPLLALRPRFVISRPEWTRRVTAPFALLFNPILVVVATLLFAGIAYWVLFDKGLASAAYDAFNKPGLLLAVFAITIVSAGFHEFGHAAALRRGGGTPGAIGAGLYLIWPAFFTDVTDGYRLSRRDRIRTDLGGLYFNALVSLVMFGVWLAVRWDGLLLVIAAQILQMVRQLPPLVRFDGYHLLADVTGVPDLFHRIGPTLRSFLPKRWRHPQSRALRPWVRIVVTLWVVLVVPLLLVTVVVTVLALPRILGSTAHSVHEQWNLLTTAAGHGDDGGAAVKALAIIALVIPAGGIVLMLLRTGRRLVTGTWRRTAGKPAKRGVAAIAMFAAVAGLAYAWMPHGGNYRPIQSYERGTVQDALPSRVAAPMSSGVQVGREYSADTVWVNDPQSPLPTADQPVVATVLTPHSGNGPTWVFPFNRPPAPGPGGNQAMAIATQDGGTLYDVAFALVWARGDTVLNRNEAYAFASCIECRAIAVSFQVVLIVGHADVVAPQNISAAVSSNCLRCVTQALAVQLAITVPPDFTPAAKAQLHKLWVGIMQFSRQLKGMSFADIQAQLADYEDQILAIVKPALPPVSSLSTMTSTTPTPSTSSLTPALIAVSPSATASEVASAAATDSATNSAPASDSASASATDSQSASSSPTASSSADPSTSQSPTSSSSPSDSPSPSPSPSPS